MAACLAVVGPARAQELDPWNLKPPQPTHTDWGHIGLIQMPTARSREEGAFALGVALVDQYDRFWVNLQLLDFVETTIRYTNIKNRRNGPTPFVGSSNYRDRGLDVKIGLLDEGDLIPELAILFRDVGGTGLFPTEALVGSKRFGPLDLTLGLAWGNAGTRGGIKNPFTLFSDSFDQRSVFSDAGSVTFEPFRGETIGLFGGVAWQTPFPGLAVKVEYDGNSYQDEPLANRFEVDSPINYAVSYAPTDWVEFEVGWQRGNKISSSLVLNTNFMTEFGIPNIKDTPVVPVQERLAPPLAAPERPASKTPARIAPDADPEAALIRRLSQEGLVVAGISQTTDKVILSLDVDSGWPGYGQVLEAAHAVGGLPGYGPARTVDVRVQRRSKAMGGITLDWMQLERSVRAVGNPVTLGPPEPAGWSALRARVERGVLTDPFMVLESLGLADAEVRVSGDALVAALPTAQDAARAGATADALMPAAAVMALRHVEVRSAAEAVLVRRAVVASSAADPLPMAKPLGKTALAEVDLPTVDVTKALAVLRDLMAGQGIEPYALAVAGDKAIVRYGNDRYREDAQSMGRMARALHAVMPDHVKRFDLIMERSGVPQGRISMDRYTFQETARNRASLDELWYTSKLEPTSKVIDAPIIAYNEDIFPSWSWSLGPDVDYQIGGPERLFFYQVFADLKLATEVAPGLIFQAGVAQNLFNNLDDLDQRVTSVIPRVRSDVNFYMAAGETWVSSMHGSYIAEIMPDLFGRISVGLFERMFGGVSGEILYRPHDSMFAVGLELNRVVQRDYEALFRFRNYTTTTGHVSLYADLPVLDLTGAVRVGQYLARDKGATFELGRTFENGVQVTAFATFTDVSAKDFGEGKFDKGVSISIPMDLFFLRSSKARNGLTYRPVTRDGGQFVGTPFPLYALTAGGSKGEIIRTWPKLLD